jgi:flavorubredoxin
MRNWRERMEKAGAQFVAESLIVNDAPSGDAVQQCKDFGAEIARGA